MRKLFMPNTPQSDRSIEGARSDYFGAGVITDAPASEIPQNALADGYNVVVYPNDIQGRGGYKRYGSVGIPAMPGRSGYSASKSGKTITCQSPAFSETDIFNFFVFPGTLERHFEIEQVVDANTAVVSDDGDIGLTVGCFFRAPVYLFEFHEPQKRWIIQTGAKLYVADVALTEWVECVVEGASPLSEAKSSVLTINSEGLLILSSSGMFWVEIDLSQPVAYRVNCRFTSAPIPSNDKGSMENAYRYLYSAARIAGSTPLYNRLTPAKTLTQTGTNEITSAAESDYGVAWTQNEISKTNKNVVGPLRIPHLAGVSPRKYHYQYTHFPVWRTCNTEATYRGKLNNADRYYWVHDLRVCAAFLATRTANEVQFTVGLAESADVGSTLKFENGDEYTITEYISPQRVKIDTDLIDSYGPAACAIGNGKVLRCSQSGDTVTRVGGDTFAETDTVIWWAAGRSVIKEYVNENTVRVWGSVTREEQGATLNPTHRHFCDTVADGTLRSRGTSLLLRNRFWEAMPNCNVGAVAGGFLLTSGTGSSKLRYCQLIDQQEYTIGYHNSAEQQNEHITGDIRAIHAFGDRVIVWTSSKTYAAITTPATYVTLDEIGETIAKIAAVDCIAENIGCFDRGSISDYGDGRVILITSEPSGKALRVFDGYRYGPNLLMTAEGQGRYNRLVQSMQNATASIAGGEVGYIVWGRN